MSDVAPHFFTAIIGSGFAGLGMAVRLKQTGVEDFVVFERANEVGGTWRDNTYPGCACDVESHLYSFSFAPHPRWSRMWSPQPEIFDYLKQCARRFNVLPKMLFNHRVEKASWNETLKKWEIVTSKGNFTATFLISATGALSEPATPDIPGLNQFRGTVFHSAKWNHEHRLEGESVAVIGTGASAGQFVPVIQPLVDKLYLFQRTPPWVLPHNNRRLSEREQALYSRFPLLLRLQRLRIYLTRELFGIGFRRPRRIRWLQKFALSYLQRKIQDPVLRKKLTPNYNIGCKRILLSRTYLPSLTQPNVEVVTNSIDSIGEDFIRTSDGEKRFVKTLILATGFQLSKIHLADDLSGKGGQTLAQSWRGSPQAYLGTTVAGFPNLFLLFGPNTGLGHSSVVLMAESQIEYILGAIRFMQKRAATTLEVRSPAQLSFVKGIDAKMQGTIWNTGCASWYLDRTGRNSVIWPGSVGAFRRKLKRFKSDHYFIG